MTDYKVFTEQLNKIRSMPVVLALGTTCKGSTMKAGDFFRVTVTTQGEGPDLAYALTEGAKTNINLATLLLTVPAQLCIDNPSLARKLAEIMKDGK